jgi:Tol biopolymer transport system component
MAIALSAAALVLSPPVSAYAAFPGGNGKLAVGWANLNDQAYNSNIWTIEPDGSGLERLTTEPTCETQPAWSPNGRWVAFTRSASNACGLRAAGDIWIVRSDGTEQRRLTDDATYDTGAAWSPDGSQLVFAASREAPGGIDPDNDLYVVNADGTGRRLLVSAERRSEFDPAWSPDGTRIAFATDIYRPDGLSHPEVELGLRTVRPDGTDERVIVPAGQLAYHSDWSPDGGSLAYTNGLDIFKVDAEGGDSTPFPSGSYTGYRVDPYWSPDGTRIAYSGFLFGHVSLDGSANMPLLCCVAGSSWQPLGPRRADFKNGPAFCRAEREFLGEQEFEAEFRTFGRCVSASR